MNIVNIIDDDGNVISCDLDPKYTVNYLGDNNKIILHKDLNIKSLKMTLGSNMTIKIEKSRHKIENLVIGALRSKGGGVYIGENFSCVDVQFLLNEEVVIKVGRDCMFSADIKIWASDAHSIIDLSDNRVINQAKGVEIGNHVWVCENARILKNTVIPSNCVVANSALVTGEFEEENVVLGGNPAKVIKRGIDWNRHAPS